MDVVNTVVIGVLIAAVGLILARITKGQSDSLRREFGAQSESIRREIDGLGRGFSEFRTEIKADLVATEQRLDRRIDGLQVAVDGMRSDLTQVALAVGVKPRASNG